MAWFYASQVTIENGSDIARVVSGEYVAAIRPGDEFKIAGFEGEEVLNAYTEDGTNDQIIQLAINWPNATQTLQPAKVKPFAVYFNEMVAEVAEVRTDITSRLASFIQFGSPNPGTVTFAPISEGDDPIVIRTVGQYQNDLDALELSASNSASDLAVVDGAINGTGGLVEIKDQLLIDFANVDGTLSGYVTTSEGYKNQSEGYRDQIQTWYGVINTSQQQVATDATNASTDAGAASTKAGEAADSALLAQRRASHPHGQLIPNTSEYSALHYKTEAQNIAGGNFALQTITVNGQPLSANVLITMTTLGFGNVQNTSDADKEISIATQAALDDLEATALIGMF